MPPRKVSNSYATAADTFYAAGRDAYVKGHDRTDTKSPSNPNNPLAWDQSFRRELSLTNGSDALASIAPRLSRALADRLKVLTDRNPGSPIYGPVENHYYAGFDDAASDWTDRGWLSSQMWVRLRLETLPEQEMLRAGYQVSYYIRGWNGTRTEYRAGEDLPAEKYLSPQEINAQIDAGGADRKSGNGSAEAGYREVTGQPVDRSYDQAAQAFYSAGRADARAGHARTDNKAPGSPNNPLAWDPSFRAASELVNSPLAMQFGRVEDHYWHGHDDTEAGWPDRGWKRSLRSGDRLPPLSFDGRIRTTKQQWFYYYYTRAWAETATARVLTDRDSLGLLSQSEIDRVIGFARADKAAGKTPPEIGYRSEDTADLSLPFRFQPLTGWPSQPAGAFGGMDALSSFALMQMMQMMQGSSRTTTRGRHTKRGNR